MPRLEKLDRMLGKLVYRLVGSICAVIALLCGYLAYRYATDWWPASAVPTLLFGIVAFAAASAVPFCFSDQRTFAEALDAMEGGVGDQPRKPKG